MRIEPLEARNLFSAGSLDTSFAGMGYVAQYFAAGYDQRAGVAVQADQKIVVAGTAFTVYKDGSYSDEVEVGRYNPDGSLDTSFGNGGVAEAPFGGGSKFITQVGLEPDGKIVVVGQSGDPNPGEVYGGFLARFDADGTLDTSFGNGGLVAVNSTDGSNVCVTGLAIQPDGKILVADVITGKVDRYNVNGTLDGSFASANLPAGSGSPSGLALEANGDVVLYDSGTAGPQVVLYNSSGTMLASVSVPIAGANALSSVAVDEYGNIVLSGAIAVASDGGTEELPFVARLTDNLELDPSFGQGGIAEIDQPVSFYNVNRSLAVQPNGQYVLTFVGLVPGGTGTVDELGLARFNFDGSLDATFGNQGLVLSSIASGPGGIAVQPDGNLVVAANGSDGAGVVARFLGNPQADAPVATFTKGPDQSVPQGAGGAIRQQLGHRDRRGARAGLRRPDHQPVALRGAAGDYANRHAQLQAGVRRLGRGGRHGDAAWRRHLGSADVHYQCRLEHALAKPDHGRRRRRQRGRHAAGCAGRHQRTQRPWPIRAGLASRPAERAGRLLRRQR